MNDPILHVFHQPDRDLPADESRRNANARKTWGGDNIELVPFCARRVASDFLDTDRRLPFIKDLFDHACNRAGEDEIVLWTNLDACLMPGTYDRVREALSVWDACHTGRMNVPDATIPPRPWEIALSDGNPGTDLIAFRPRWWRRVHRDMFDALIACEAFDAALVQLIKRDCQQKGNVRRSVYHEFHGRSLWESQPGNPCNRHNNLLGAQFGRKCGLAVSPSKRADGLFDVDWDGCAQWPRTEARLSFDGEFRQYVRDTYIETGIGEGHSLKAALTAGFRRCVSIESDPATAERMRDIFREDATIITGDSAELLGSAIRPDERTTLFLDAHTDASCPLLAELAVIAGIPWSHRPVILIDDSDCFNRDRWRRRELDRTHNADGWPTIQQIRLMLPGYDVCERGTVYVCEAAGYVR